MSDTTPASPTVARVRLVALGDELLAGAGDPKAMGWLSRALARHNDGADLVDVYSSAVPGETSADLAARWEADVRRLIDQRNDPDPTRVVLGLGSADLDHGISLARSRLNLATVLDGLEHLRIPTFVVGPAPSPEHDRNRGITRLSQAFEDVCARRRTPYVDPASALQSHDQYLADVARSDRGLPSEVGYGLITWLVLHGEFSRFLARSTS